MAGATLFERAQALSSVNREEQDSSLLNKIVRDQEGAENDEERIRIKEQGIMQQGELYKQEGKAKELADLIKVTRPFLSSISKAKAAKLVRSLVDMFLDMDAGTGIEVSPCLARFENSTKCLSHRFNCVKTALSGPSRRSAPSSANPWRLV